MNTCGSNCWLSCSLLAIAWWLGSSGLLFYTWNKVICAFTKMKAGKYWQALLVVATVCAFCAPRAYMKRSCHQNQCRYGHQDCCDKGKFKKDCPYSASDEKDGEAPAKHSEKK